MTCNTWNTQHVTSGLGMMDNIGAYYKSINLEKLRKSTLF